MQQREISSHTVDALMREGVADGVFPGAVLLVSEGRCVLFHRCYGVTDIFSGQPVTLDTVFDLASLTKPLATTLGVMKLVAEEKLGLDWTIGSVLPPFKGTDKSAITVAQLLRHTSGMPDYRPFYIKVSQLPPDRRRAALLDLLVNEPPVHPPGDITVYSDLGFMVLARIVEKIAGDRLDRFVAREIYRPLGISDLFFRDLSAPLPERVFAATEKCPWREKLLCGEVHDDNAWAVGGIDGHAGLFGTAAAVHGLLTKILSAYGGGTSTRVIPGHLVHTFLNRVSGKERALGFDRPSEAGSSSGRCFSRNSVGHLGFTGTSFWMDPDRGLLLVLLTNRVHPSRENTQIRAFRPKLHDAVAEGIGQRLRV